MTLDVKGRESEINQFRKFININQFHNIIYAANKYPEDFPDYILYKAKVKLHGTNSAISIFDGNVVAQSRNNIVIEGHYGFANFVEKLKDNFRGFPDCHIYGEWIGAGIQAKVSASKLSRKRFCVFSILIGDYYYVEPEGIEKFLCMCAKTTPEELRDFGIHVISWLDKNQYKISIRDEKSCSRFKDRQEPVIQNIDKSDPWIKSEFGIDGIGEGLVYYPVADSYEIPERYTGNYNSRDRKEFGIHESVFSNLTFKAKGEKHKKAPKQKKEAIRLTPQELSSQNDFVKMFVTEDRLHQILDQHCQEFDMKKLGIFIREFSKDVMREGADEMESNNFDWKFVQKPVTIKARDWFMKGAGAK